MTGAEILAFVREGKFEPIRLYVSDGTTYDIQHPDQMLITQRLIYIGLRKPDELQSMEPPENVARVDAYHITQIVPLRAVLA